MKAGENMRRLDTGYGMREELISTGLQSVRRLFKRRKWSRKQLKRTSLDRSEVLRCGYLDICQFAAEDLVFLNESIFYEKTDWNLAASDQGAEGLR